MRSAAVIRSGSLSDDPKPTAAAPVLFGADDLHALLDEAGHGEALTLRSSAHLQGGDAFRAFLFADRRCRIGSADTHDFLLRAEALRRLGYDKAADRDIRRAYDLDPTDVLVNRLMLDLSRPEAVAAARWAIGDPRSSSDLREAALGELFAGPHRVVASLVVESGRLGGWVAWRGETPCGLVIEAAAGSFRIALDATLRPTRLVDHAVARIDVAVDSPVSVTAIAGAGDPVDALVWLRHNPTGTAEGPPVRSSDLGGSAARRPAASVITVVVPIYDDVEITRSCLEALARQTARGCAIGVIAVDDATPDPSMRAAVADLCQQHGFQLISNSHNLGFVGAVNKALDRAPEGDVVFLNSDVILPEGSLERLAEAAYARPGIGIVNPLTNNGQFCSFPGMFGTAPLESAERIAAIDRIAARVNRGGLVSLPSGNGFCMYVTQACLEGVGRMSEVYLRGYYEDVEFSLRARQRGFDSVCATDVYVGHKGSASFKDEKRSLVKRNQRALRRRFAIHRADTRAFVKADPLRAARAAIEAEADPLGRVDVVVAGSALQRGLIEPRAAMLRRAGASVAILSWAARDPCVVATLETSKGPPRNRTYALARRSPQADMLEDLRRLAPDRIELAGAPGPMATTLDVLARRGMAFGYVIGESLGRAARSRGRCEVSGGGAPCAACVQAFDRDWEPTGVGLGIARVTGWSDTPPSVVVAADDIARDVAADLTADVFKTSRFERLKQPDAMPAGPRVGTSGPLPLLGILAPQADPETEHLLGALAVAGRLAGSPWGFVLLGQGLNERRLLSVGNLFVTGPIDDDEELDFFNHYGIAALLAPQRWSGYGALTRWTDRVSMPKAYFDWSLGALPAAGPDLSLDPRLCDRRAADLICGWLAAGTPETAP